MDRDGNHYDLRTIRAYRATEWVKLAMEYRVMNWKPEPPNPLQHTDWKTTLDHYAVKGCESELEARRRCSQKYGTNPLLRQPWMDTWTDMKARHEPVEEELSE